MTVSRKTFLAAGAALPFAAILAACGAKTDKASTSGLTVTHHFGTTTVPANPKRVATVAWGNQDVALALGILPVGMPKQTWGVTDDSGMLEWTKAKVDELVKAGGTTPKLWDETDKIDFEAVASVNPDVILAAYSGLTKEDYETLSKIAPTIAYPKEAWGTPWRDMIRLDAQGLDKAKEGEDLVAEMEALISKELASYSNLKGKTAAFFYADPTDTSKIGFYAPMDSRTGFLADLGMKIPESVTKAAETSSSFYIELSAEKADTLADVDVMVMYGDDKDLATFQADALLGTIPAIKNGAVAFVGNATPLSASMNPSPLSLPWGLADYLKILGAAADKAQ